MSTRSTCALTVDIQHIPLPNILSATKEISTDRKGITDASRAVNDWLCSQGNDKWLLIFDDVQEMTEGEACSRGPSELDSTVREAFDAYKYVPQVSHGSVLITSRISSVAYAFGAEPVHIDAMSEGESIQLLCKASRRGSGEEAGELLLLFKTYLFAERLALEMRALASCLGRHPLALTQAGRYLHETRSSVISYLKKYDTRFKMLLERRLLSREYQNGSVDAVLSLSFDSLAARDPSAAALLKLMGSFDKSNIFFRLFRCLPELRVVEHPMSASHGILNPHAHIDRLPSTWLDQLCADEDMWLTSISALLDFSFIRHNHNVNTISLHPLIHDWSLRSCEKPWADDNMAAAANILGAALLDNLKNRTGAAHSILTSNINYWYSLLCLQPAQSAMMIGANGAAVFEIAHFYRRRGFFDRYNVLSNDLLRQLTTTLGPTNRATVELKLDMFTVLLEDCKWEEAIQAASSFPELILQIHWLPTLTLKENNAVILVSLAWHLSIACGEVAKSDPLKELLVRFTELLDDPEIARVQPSVDFTRLWLEHHIALIEAANAPTSTYDPTSLIEAETRFLAMLDDTSLWPDHSGRQHTLMRSHLLRLLGEQYYAQHENDKAKTCLRRSLQLFKEIDGLHGRTTLGIAGALLSRGWTTNAPPAALSHPNWHHAITSILQQIEKRQRQDAESDAAGRQRSGSAALSHLHWEKAFGSVREVVREDSESSGAKNSTMPNV